MKLLLLKKLAIGLTFSILVLSSLGPIQRASADLAGHETGHGGSDVGVLFNASFYDSLRNLQQSDPDLLHSFATPDFMSKIQQAVILSTDVDLEVQVNGLSQPCVATNDQTSIIQVNSDRWKAISNHGVQEAIALHEMLSLQKLEDTGKYPISSQYLALFNLPAALLPTGISPIQFIVVAGETTNVCLDQPFFGNSFCSQKLLSNTLSVGTGASEDEAKNSAIGQCIQTGDRFAGTCSVLTQQIVMDEYIGNTGENSSWYDVASIQKGCVVIAIHSDTDPSKNGIFGVGTSPTLVDSEQVALASVNNDGVISVKQCLP